MTSTIKTAIDLRPTYRACYAQSADGQGEIVLTGEEHSHMSDDDLAEEAIAEARRAGCLDGWGGEDALRSMLRIGTWRGSKTFGGLAAS